MKLTVALLLITVPALALPNFMGPIKPTKGGSIEKASCSLCHIGKSPKLNAYGVDLKASMVNKKFTDEVLKKTAQLDSDKDGVKNGAELSKDTLPGDSKSK